MMKFFGFLLSAMFFFTSFIAPDLDVTRANYKKVVSDKDLCKEMISELRNSQNISATHLAYFGGLQAIWANHVFNPITKLKTFQEGKENIEKAIETEPNNVELRFIRLSIQRNVPGFLGYRSNVKEDSEFIKKNLHQVESPVLQKNIEALLID